MKIELDIEEGDVLLMNERWWEVKNLEKDPFTDLMTLSCETGDAKVLTEEELQEMVDFSGSFKLIKKDYRGISD